MKKEAISNWYFSLTNKVKAGMNVQSFLLFAYLFFSTSQIQELGLQTAYQSDDAMF